MGNSSDVIAGGAVVRVGADDSPYNAVLTRAEKRLKAFAQAALDFGAKLGGLGIGLGAGLITAAKAFADTGVDAQAIGEKLAVTGAELEALQQKLSTVDTNSSEFQSLSKEVERTSAEFDKLTKESDRLNKILGGQDVQAAVRLSETFGLLKDSISSIVVQIGAALEPVLTAAATRITRVASGIAEFIGQNRSLVMQIANVTGGIIAAGASIAALGAAIYLTAPLLKAGMIAASIATAAYSATCATASVVMGTFSIAAKVLSAAMGVVKFAVLTTMGIVKSLAITISLATVTTTLAVNGYGALAKAIQVLSVVMRIGTLAGGLMAAVWALQAAGVTAVSVVSAGLSVVWTAMSAAGSAVAAVLSLVNGNLVATALVIGGLVVGTGLLVAGLIWLSAEAEKVAMAVWNSIGETFNAIGKTVTQLPSTISGAFGAIWNSARSLFSNIVAAVSNTYASTVNFFSEMLRTGQTTFKALSDAISAGNIQLAIDVVWAGIKVAWLSGTAGVVKIWKTAMVELEGAFADVVTAAKKGFATILGESLKLAIDLNPLYSDDQKGHIKHGLDIATDLSHHYIDGTAQPDKDKRTARITKINSEGASTELLDAKDKLHELSHAAQAAAASAAEFWLDPEKLKSGQFGFRQAQSAAGTMASPTAQARGSSGAASTIARAYNNQSSIPAQQLNVARLALRENQRTNTLLGKQKPVNIQIVQRN